MSKYILYRLAHSIVVLLGVSLIVFLVIRLSGDPTTLMLPLEATQEQIERTRRELGFDRPLHIQYLTFVGNAIRGDFGNSLRHRQSAMSLVLERFPATLRLALAGLGVAMLIAIPLGILAAIYRGSIIDRLLTVGALAGQSIPSFWLGLVLIFIVGVQWRLLPVSGGGTWRHLVLPAVTLGAFSAALIFRLMRSNLIDTLKQDYVRTARSKGLPEGFVIWRHAARNAALPVTTVIALQLSALIGGAIIVETVFAYPGMGLLAVQAINNRDFPVVQAFVISLAVVVTVVNLLTDLFYGVLDPRIRFN